MYTMFADTVQILQPTLHLAQRSKDGQPYFIYFSTESRNIVIVSDIVSGTVFRPKTLSNILNITDLMTEFWCPIIMQS